MTIPVIGLTEEEARTLIHERGLKCRVTMREGMPSVVTMDYRPDRYNLRIVDGKVVGVHFG